jgi:hypoxanthine phosphoribosyltransferase
MKAFAWRDIDSMVHLLQRGLARRSFDAVVGIARSGLIPAVMLSHGLGVRRFAVLDIPRTESDDVFAAKRPPSVDGALNLEALHDAHLLLVDDIVGSGATLRLAAEYLRSRCASVVSAVLVVNRANLGTSVLANVVDLHACEVHDWVVFPWEGKSATGERIECVR